MELIARVTGNGHRLLLIRMLHLPMAATLPRQIPAILQHLAQ